MKKISKKKVKKLILPSAALTASLCVSFVFTIGAIIGYIGTKIFDKKFIKTGKVEPFTIDFGKWEVHLHHWISGCLAISAVCFIGFPSVLPVFWLGTLSGLAFHDIHTDKIWYKVVYKKLNTN